MANKHLSEDKIQYTIVIPNWGYIFIKSFKKTDGSRYYYFTSVTVSIDGKEVVVSNQEKSRNRILRLLIGGNVVWRTPKDATTSSAEKQGLDYVHSNNAESETKGSGITPQSISSVGKDTQSSNNEQGSSVKNQETDAIPTDDDGNVLYERVPIERIIRDLFDGSLDDAEVKEFVAANVEAAQRAHDKISNKPPKISTNKQKYLEAKAKWQGQVKAAKEKLDYWNAVEAERQKLTHTTDEEVEANERELSGEAAREDYRMLIRIWRCIPQKI